MLYVIAGRREDALRPIRGISPSQQDFWSQEIYGLANYLDTDRNPDGSRRAAEAVDRLREAAAKLGEQATLSVKNLAFCTEVTSYGVYKTFAKNEFHAGQEVLLYAEVENFKSRHNEQGFQTALRSSYQILDQHGPGSIAGIRGHRRTLPESAARLFHALLTSGCPNGSTAAPTRCSLRSKTR